MLDRVIWVFITDQENAIQRKSDFGCCFESHFKAGHARHQSLGFR